MNESELWELYFTHTGSCSTCFHAKYTDSLCDTGQGLQADWQDAYHVLTTKALHRAARKAAR